MRYRGHWRPVPLPAYRDHYSVSRRGQVVRAGRLRDGCLARSFAKGRPTVSMSVGSQRKTKEVARLVAGAFLGPPPGPGAILKHKDGNINNCRASNLVWTNRQDPTVKQGVTRRLTPEQEAAVRAAPKRVTNARLADQYGVSTATISYVRRGLKRNPKTGVISPRNRD